MDIILTMMVVTVALLIGFALVMAIDLNKWINIEVRAEQEAIRLKTEALK